MLSHNDQVLMLLVVIIVFIFFFTTLGMHDMGGELIIRAAQRGCYMKASGPVHSEASRHTDVYDARSRCCRQE